MLTGDKGAAGVLWGGLLSAVELGTLAIRGSCWREVASLRGGRWAVACVWAPCVAAATFRILLV